MTTPVELRLVLADDQELVRSGLRLLLELEPGMRIVAEAADGAAAVDAVLDTRPDVVLMDLRMPRVDGLEATRRIVRGGSATRVLVLTTFSADRLVYDALAAGASGFLLKDSSREHLVHGVRTVAEGKALLDPSITRRLVERFVTAPPPAAGGRPDALAALSRRETEVLRLIARGRSNAEIAAALFLGETTVKTYVGRLAAKLGLRDRLQAVVLAYETGLVRPGEPDPLPETG